MRRRLVLQAFHGGMSERPLGRDDFLNPVLALRRLIDRGGELGLDEPELISYAEHDAWIDYVPVRRRGIASDFS